MPTQEQIQQIVETIKTLNINFNDATTQKIAEAIIPVVKMYIIQGYIKMGLTFVGVVGILTTILFLIKWVVKRDHEQFTNEKKIKEVEKFIESLHNYNGITDIRTMLTEILEYMPRNKKKRNINIPKSSV